MSNGSCAVQRLVAVDLPHLAGIPLGDLDDARRGDVIIAREHLLCQGDPVLRLREPAHLCQVDALVHAGIRSKNFSTTPFNSGL